MIPIFHSLFAWKESCVPARVDAPFMDKPLWGLRVQAPFGAVGIGTGWCFPVFPKVDTPYGQALTGLRVQAPFGARVLSFVCCAPDHGFSPQSGLVQRGVLYAAWGSENHTTALRARKCIPPLVAGATTLPGGKHVTGFSVAYGSLRIQFLCHPRSSVGR